MKVRHIEIYKTQMIREFIGDLTAETTKIHTITHYNKT